jgi:asparagine synthase (glutamine-hydrolysing)
MAGKCILKAAVEDLLPNTIVHRQKMGFPTPWAYWLSGPSPDGLLRLVMEPRTLESGFFPAEGLKRLFAEHTAGRRDHGNRIWRLLIWSCGSGCAWRLSRLQIWSSRAAWWLIDD